MTTRIEFRNVAKRFGELLAVENVSLAVSDGEIVSLIGVSGPNSHVAFMLQKDLLLPWRTPGLR